MTRYEELLLGLLGRIAFPEDKLRTDITRNKRNPDAYIRGYNACDGRHTVQEVAAVVDVSLGTLVPILQEWERRGIIYELETERKGKFYKHLYPLGE